MEHLTKQQIVLLTLLVGFVTSIASSIVTVSLLDQGTPTVTQTINRVVERTIEKTSPSTVKETVFIKEDQALVSAIAKSEKGIVRIQYFNQPLALGLIVSSSGKIIALLDVVYSTGLTALLDGGNTVPLRFVSRDPDTHIAVLEADQGSDYSSVRAYSPVSFGNSDTVKLGQAAVVMGGLKIPEVASTIVSSVIKESNVKTTALFTSLKDTSFDSQSILVNLLGEVIGIQGKTSDRGFIPSNIIKTYATP